MLDSLRQLGILQTEHYIDGQWAPSEQAYDVINPASGDVLLSIARAGAAQTKHAIDAAHCALIDWKQTVATKRATALRRWAQLLMSNEEHLAYLMTLEQGKPVAEAASEVSYAASFLDWFAEEAVRIRGDILPSIEASARLFVIKEPVGVVAAITPWNFPLAMITRKAGAALAAGCTMVVKPSEETPLSALALAALSAKAGIPPGVFNVISGNEVEIGNVLMKDPRVRKLSFTGSTAVGRHLFRRSADTLKRVSLELGGNAPFIVCEDADIEAAIDGAIAAKFRNTGQTCVCVNRFLVHAGIYTAFTEGLAQAVKRLKVGNGLDEGVAQGPLINHEAFARVQNHVKDAREHGGVILCGGQQHPNGGTFWTPTVIGNASTNMLIAREETFGPVAPCFRFDSETESLALANDTPAGLAAYVYTKDMGRAWRMAEGLEAGMVGINEGVISNAIAPFGGMKQSGVGREGSHYGLQEYQEIKYVMMGGLGL